MSGGDGTNTGTSSGIDAVEHITVTNSDSITGGIGGGTGDGGAGIRWIYRKHITNASGGSINGGNGTSSAVGGVARLQSIEHIDLTGSGNETLQLTVQDVLDLSQSNVTDP